MELTVRKVKNPYFNGSPRNDRYHYRVIDAPANMDRMTVKMGDRYHKKLEVGTEWLSERTVNIYIRCGWRVTIENAEVYDR